MPIRTRFTTWRPLATAATAALLTTLLAPMAAQAAPRESRPVYSYDNAVREAVWVDTGLDGDGDGRNDRVAVDIVRPRELARQGRKVPVVMDASPYYSCCGRGNESQKKTYDANGNVVQMPLFYDNYFVPRGYAFVGVDLAGTNRSDGCDDVGGRSDILSAKAVVDWLNGRATAYTTRTGTARAAKATWTNGRTGMIGKSWDGTIANGVAATGVEGLKTIVPISAISSWYDYYFQQGAPLYDSGPDWLSDYVNSPDARAKCAAVQQKIVDGAPRTGDRTGFWTERDYVKDARKVKASVFLIHGQQDLNVRMKHVGQWWDALGRNGVDRKIWLSQTGHVDPFDFRRAEWVATLHRWMDYWLHGVPNGITDEPRVDIERAADVWETHADWPVPSTVGTEVWLRPDGLGLVPAADPVTQSFQDSPTQTQNTMILNPDTVQPNRLAYLSAPLTAPLHVSGTPVVKVRAAADQVDTNLGAILVDYGTAERVNHRASGEGIVTLTTEDCWGEDSATDNACYRQTQKRVHTADVELVTKGVMDAQNRQSLRTPTPLVPGERYNFDFPLLPEDYVFQPGHRIGVIIVGSYPQYSSQVDQTRATIEVALKSSRIVLPIVGGTTAAHAAGL
jgi:X-Pro dipeptidyl-peptidase